MRCVVTGASGHVGSFLTRLLLKRGHEVLAVVRPTSDLWRLGDVLGRLSLAYAELEEVDRLVPQLCDFRPEVAFHLAWTGVTADYRNSEAQITTNLFGSLRFFQAVRVARCPVFVGLGSQAEFGLYDRALTEDLPVRPVTAYGVSKLSAGLLTAKLAEIAGLRHVWLRLVSTYGPKDDTRHLIPSVILQLLRGETPRLSPGEQLCDYLYVEDAVEALLSAATAKNASGVLVFGSGEAHSVREICEKLKDLVDPGATLAFGAEPYRSDQIMHLEADISRIRSVTGWSPRASLDEGLARTVAYYRAMEGES